MEFNRTSPVLSCPIPVRITNGNVTKLQHSTKKANTANLTNVKLLPLIGTCTTKYDFDPSVLLANTMSLLPKIDEVRCVMQRTSSILGEREHGLATYKSKQIQANLGQRPCLPSLGQVLS